LGYECFAHPANDFLRKVYDVLQRIHDEREDPAYVLQLLALMIDDHQAERCQQQQAKT
jgi:hypothetical protein